MIPAGILGFWPWVPAGMFMFVREIFVLTF